MMNEAGVKRLYKSHSERMIDGVCGGVARYFGLDPTLVRIAWVLLTFLGGSGILLYIVAMIIMPSEPPALAAQSLQTTKPSKAANEVFWGILLILIGTLWLAGNLGFSFWQHWWGFSWGVAFPVLLILAGIAFLMSRGKAPSETIQTEDQAGEAPDGTPAPAPLSAVRIRRLRRSRFERKLFGVCGGLAEYFNIDPTIVRLLFVVSALASFGLTAALYVVLAIVVPGESLIPRMSETSP